jgi:hypothetical protein
MNMPSVIGNAHATHQILFLPCFPLPTGEDYCLEIATRLDFSDL